VHDRDIVVDARAEGTLVHVLEGSVKAENKLAVVCAERDLVPPHVRAFIDHLLVWAPELDRTGKRPPATAGRRRRA
jgi:DNA-binding transcriptional LysR family regulator